MPILGLADHVAFWCIVANCPSSPRPFTATFRSPELKPPTSPDTEDALIFHHSACSFIELNSAGLLFPSILHAPPVGNVQTTLSPKTSTNSAPLWKLVNGEVTSRAYRLSVEKPGFQPPHPISAEYPYGGSSLITISDMYLLAPPNLLPHFQLPFKLLSSWKLGGERELSLNNYYRYHKLYFAKYVCLWAAINVRAKC